MTRLNDPLLVRQTDGGRREIIQEATRTTAGRGSCRAAVCRRFSSHPCSSQAAVGREIERCKG